MTDPAALDFLVAFVRVLVCVCVCCECGAALLSLLSWLRCLSVRPAAAAALRASGGSRAGRLRLIE